MVCKGSYSILTRDKYSHAFQLPSFSLNVLFGATWRLFVID